MLVLSRKINEAIVIDSNIRITLLSIRGNHVRIGIEAPDSVSILREELLAPAAIDEGRAKSVAVSVCGSVMARSAAD